MIRDRLPELLQRSQSVNSDTSSNGSLHVAINMEHQTTASVDTILQPYSEVRYNLAQISNNLEIMSRMTQTINIRNFNENEMDELRQHNLRLGNKLMNRFKEFKADLPPENIYTLEARMKRTLFHGLYQSYVDIWQRNEEFLQVYERKLKKNLQMHSKIINYNSTEEEIEELIANKQTNLFVDNILEETEKERKNLRDLMDRFTELKKLEKSIEDVHALFLRIQSLVMEQSETIQRIEFHVQQANLYVDKGADELVQAEHHQKSARRKKFLLITALLLGAFVFIFVAYYF